MEFSTNVVVVKAVELGEVVLQCWGQSLEPGPRGVNSSSSDVKVTSNGGTRVGAVITSLWVDRRYVGFY